MDGFLRFLKYHYRRSPVTTVLIVLNTIMVLIVMLSGGFNIFNLVRFASCISFSKSRVSTFNPCHVFTWKFFTLSF